MVKTEKASLGTCDIGYGGMLEKAKANSSEIKC